jgi:4-amino-4-deoxy-L-arabinose transferase-like glycosyltransferase
MEGDGGPALGRSGTPRSGLGATATIVALGLVLYLPGLGREILRNPLEVKYALVAREMLGGSPWLVAHLFGELYPDKPPLYFWATAGLGWLAGGRIDEVTARLPAALAAMAGCLLVYRLGTELFGRTAALLSGLVLATSSLFFWYARQGHPDQFLIAAGTLACLGLWRAIAQPTGPARRRWIALAYAAMGFGVLSKGLLGLLLPLFAGAAYCALTGPLRRVPARLGLGLGLAVFLAVVLAWYGPAVALYGRPYLYETLIHQHLVRYTRTWVHHGPWYYYFLELPTGFFPWVVFLPSALVLGWRARDRRAAARADIPAAPSAGLAARDAAAGSPTLFPLGWLLSGFVFLSLSTSKRGAYLLPLYPAAALLVGWVWTEVLAGRVRARWIGIPFGGLCAGAAAVGLTLAVLPRQLVPGHMVDTLVPSDPGLLVGVVAVLLGGAMAAWFLWRRGRPRLALDALVALQGIVLLLAATIRAPHYELRFPVREFAARVEAAVPPGEPVLSLLDDYNFLVAFYLDRSIRPLPDPAALHAIRHGTAPRYALIDERDDGVLGQSGVQALAETRFGPKRPKRIVLVRLDAITR